MLYSQSMSYGVDIWALGPLRTGRLASGSQLLAQAIYRRLTTPRGTLRGGPDADIYGLDLSAYVGHVGFRLASAALPGLISAECLKDDRLAAVDVVVSVDAVTPGVEQLTVAITATPEDESEAFTLTLGVSQVDVTVLGVPS